MASSSESGSGRKPFAEFLRSAPHHQGGGVTLSGRVSQSDKEGHFVLDLGGQTLELPVEAVRDYQADEPAGTVHLVLDRAALEKLAAGALKPLVHDVPPKPLWQDVTIKELILDPIWHQGIPIPDPAVAAAAGGATPFVLATQNQAPAQALALQGLSGQVKPVVQDLRTVASADVLKQTHKDPLRDTLKEPIKDPIQDQTFKETLHDTIKEIAKDPLQDTVKEVYETLWEGGGTLAEGGGGGGGTLAEGGGFPGGGLPGGGGPI